MICWKCKHPIDEHWKSIFSMREYGAYYCSHCATKYIGDTGCWHDIETNLDYIERIAKEKNLI